MVTLCIPPRLARALFPRPRERGILGLHAARGLERDFRWLAPRGQPNRPSPAYLPRSSPPTSRLFLRSAVPPTATSTVAIRNDRSTSSTPAIRSWVANAASPPRNWITEPAPAPTMTTSVSPLITWETMVSHFRPARLKAFALRSSLARAVATEACVGDDANGITGMLTSPFQRSPRT